VPPSFDSADRKPPIPEKRSTNLKGSESGTVGSWQIVEWEQRSGFHCGSTLQDGEHELLLRHLVLLALLLYPLAYNVGHVANQHAAHFGLFLWECLIAGMIATIPSGARKIFGPGARVNAVTVRGLWKKLQLEEMGLHQQSVALSLAGRKERMVVGVGLTSKPE